MCVCVCVCVYVCVFGSMQFDTVARGEVSQMLASATSKWELDREAWAASLVLRIRTGPECPEDNLMELV